MDKLFELLGVEKLDESAQGKIKEKLEIIIETKSKELLKAKLTEEKEKLVDIYESKFEEYKEEITSKFSNFVDSVLDEEMTIPEKILEFAKKGELYHDLIEQFKIRLSVDEGLLDKEVKSLLKEAKDEIQNLRDNLDKSITENLEVKKDAQELASELYLRQKCDGLTESQKKHVIEMLEGVFVQSEIDRKFDIIIESLKINEKDEDDKDKDDKDKDDKDKDKDDKNGKGKIDTDEDDKDKDKDDKNESTNPFAEQVKEYVKILHENKIP